MNTKEQRAQELRRGRYLIAILAAMLHQKAVPPLPEGMTWQMVYNVARYHSLDSMVLAGVEPMVRQADPALYADWNKQRSMNMVQTLTQISEQQRLVEAFSKAELPVLLVKGSALRVLYPSPNYRQMSDVDILTSKEDTARAEKLLMELGYQETEKDSTQENEASFFLPPYMSVELHNSPVNPQDPRAPYYEDIWTKTVENPALPHVFHLRTEDEYLYLLVHFIKHYDDAGIGIRQVMDVYLYQQAYGSSMDAAYLAKETAALGIDTMRTAIEQLAQLCFSGEEPPEEPDALVREMEEVCLLSGIYGSTQSRSIRMMQKVQQAGSNNGAGWKLRYLWRRLFPPLEELYRRYPKARRAPWLVPYYWLCRLLDGDYWKRRFLNEIAGMHDEK